MLKGRNKKPGARLPVCLFRFSLHAVAVSRGLVCIGPHRLHGSILSDADGVFVRLWRFLNLGPADANMASMFVKVSNIPYGIDEKDLAISLHQCMDSQVKNKFLSCELDWQGESAVLEFEAGSLVNTWAALEKIIVDGKPLSVLNKDTALSDTPASSVTILKNGIAKCNVSGVQSISLPVKGIAKPLSIPEKGIVQAISSPTSGILRSLANSSLACVQVPTHNVGMPNSPTIHEEMDVDEGVGSEDSIPNGESREDKSLPKRSSVVPVTNYLVYFDLETTGVDLCTCEIVQIAASCEKKSYNVYMMPLHGIPPEASRVNGLKVVGGKLLKHGRPVTVTPHKEAWIGFVKYLKDMGNVTLVAHCGANFDFHLLAREVKKYGLMSELGQLVTGCVDSILIFRNKLPGRASYRQVDLARSYGISTDEAHDALGDVQILSKLFSKVGVAPEDIKSKCVSLKKYFL
ncbi:hypothetical protein ONE63_007380 [Megalurothrips usitatus]|uniref:Exonuclease domain-containing protein n=1 Tax=Megalurothrips usitatus TaxID=439358 RepID=A0AAV7XPZ9_9NEOP|nr:hypothetical protein ONE63_007380 [Megalurothrips usitatus]